MAEFRISVDLSPLLDAAHSAVNEQVFPLLNQAVRAVAQQAQTRWKEAVYRAKLWDGERAAYMESIQMHMTGPFSALVWSDYRYAAEIEAGRPARDLKRMLDTSLKVRVSKDGHRYMYIPFRHSAPGNTAHGPDMPQHVYDMARNMAPSRVIGQTTRKSGTGAHDMKTRKHLTVPQSVYSWGGRLAAGSMGPNKKGKTDRFANMYRFDTSTPGGGKSSAYMTFRTMSDKSNGWIVPAKPGLHLAQSVATEMQPLAEQAFTEAVKRTLG